MKQKYDFYLIKAQFFASPIPEVKKFFEDEYGTYTSHIKSKTKGWSEEKKKYKE